MAADTQRYIVDTGDAGVFAVVIDEQTGRRVLGSFDLANMDTAATVLNEVCRLLAEQEERLTIGRAAIGGQR